MAQDDDRISRDDSISVRVWGFGSGKETARAPPRSTAPLNTPQGVAGPIYAILTGFYGVRRCVGGRIVYIYTQYGRTSRFRSLATVLGSEQ